MEKALESYQAKTSMWKYVKYLLCFASLLLLFRLFVLDLYYTPTGSMEKTIDAGSYFLVSKASYGAKLPERTTAIPLVSFIFRGINFDKKLWKNSRLPPLKTIESHDMVLTQHNGTKFIKRVVGLPGDSVTVVSGHAKTNDHWENKIPTAIHTFLVASEDIALMEELRNTAQTKWMFTDKNTFKVTGSASFFDHLKTLEQVNVSPVFYRKDTSAREGIFPRFKQKQWDRTNYGPIKVPYKGMTITLDSTNIQAYASTIEQYESSIINQKGQKTFINNILQDTYTFKKDYFFLLGDNRMESIDSRFLGFFPKENILGEIMYIF